MKAEKARHRAIAKILIIGLFLTFWGVFSLGCDECDDCRVVAVGGTPPDAPQGVYSVTGDNAVYLYWIPSPEPDFDHYWVWRSDTEAEGPYERKWKTYDNHFVDNTADNGYTYYYAVTAVDTRGNESEDLSRELVFDTPRPDGCCVTVHDFRTAPSAAGFDFHDGRVRADEDYRTDIFFEYDPDYDAFFVWVEGDTTDIQDFGYTDDLDELGWAPDDGWARLPWLEAVEGHSYYVWTWDNHYAKFRIDELNYNNRTATISWAFQEVPGLPELMPERPERIRYDVPLVKMANDIVKLE